MKKSILITFFFAVLASCTIKGPLSIKNTEDLIEIQNIINENFDDDTELYKLTFSASELSNDLSTINRTFIFKNKFFNDVYFLSDNRFTDPKNTTKPFKINKTFKKSAVDISIIPEKYNEALNLIAEKKLLEGDKALYLSSWTFETDKNGLLCARFRLNYYVHSSRHGRVSTTTYNSFDFEVDSKNTLIFKN